METINRYGIVNETDWLVRSNWAVHHFDTKEAAKSWITNVKKNNPPDKIALLGKKLFVREIECYKSTGEAIGCYWPVPKQKGVDNKGNEHETK